MEFRAGRPTTMSYDADVGFSWSERREVKSGVGGDNRSQYYSALGVRFPPSKFNTLSAAPELVERIRVVPACIALCLKNRPMGLSARSTLSIQSSIQI